MAKLFKKRKEIGFYCIIIFTLHSCASLINSKKAALKISGEKGSKIIFKNDTIALNKNPTKIKTNRSKDSLKITVFKNQLKRDFYLDSKISNLFWLNLASNYGLGMLVDLTNKKRFTYKKNLHFVTDSVSNKIIISNKKVIFIPKNKVFIYTSPLQAFDFFSIPMKTIGTEYFIKKNLSLSAEYGAKIYSFPERNYRITYIEEKGSNYRFEGKLYNITNTTQNVHLNEYIGLEFRKIRSQYNTKINYFDKNLPNQNSIIDDFATQKNVTIVNLKYGILIPLGKKFYFDFYTGVGLRTKRFNHINLEYDKNIHQIEDEYFFFWNHRKFKNYNEKTFLNISGGFKFGIKI